jgi:hypothetical protein
MAEDPARTVALALAEEICPGCACAEHKMTPRMFCRNKAPCPYFHPDNFYYDSGLKRFWCHNWVDIDGNHKPPKST